MIQLMQLEQDMPISTNKRPFLTVIIPTYNPTRRFQVLLSSLCVQKLQKDDLQVIIVDDHSTENYENIVQSFKNKINIKQVQTQYNNGPGNARQLGTEYATGQWITFIDQDDYFNEGSFLKVKNIIKKYPQIELLETSVEYKQQETGRTLLVYNPTQANRQPGWIHGMFFNLDNFWKKYNFYFPKDLTSHQDVALTVELFILKHYKSDINKSIGKSSVITYIWYKTTTTASNKKYDYNGSSYCFHDRFFNNYCYASLGILLKACKEDKYNKKDGFEACSRCLQLIYQRSEKNNFLNPMLIKENYQYLYSLLNEMLFFFNKTIEDIKKYFLINSNEYVETATYALLTSEPYIYKHTFFQWLDLLYTKQLFNKGENY